MVARVKSVGETGDDNQRAQSSSYKLTMFRESNNGRHTGVNNATSYTWKLLKEQILQILTMKQGNYVKVWMY